MQFKAKNQQYRAVSWISQTPDSEPRGQQMTMWLPSGKYDVIAQEEITVYYRGVGHTHEAIRFHNAKGHVYYVTTNQFSEEALLGLRSMMEQDNSL